MVVDISTDILSKAFTIPEPVNILRTDLASHNNPTLPSLERQNPHRSKVRHRRLPLPQHFHDHGRHHQSRRLAHLRPLLRSRLGSVLATSRGIRRGDNGFLYGFPIASGRQEVSTQQEKEEKLSVSEKSIPDLPKEFFGASR